MVQPTCPYVRRRYLVKHPRRAALNAPAAAAAAAAAAAGESEHEPLLEPAEREVAEGRTPPAPAPGAAKADAPRKKSRTAAGPKASGGGGGGGGSLKKRPAAAAAGDGGHPPKASKPGSSSSRVAGRTSSAAAVLSPRAQAAEKHKAFIRRRGLSAPGAALCVEYVLELFEASEDAGSDAAAAGEGGGGSGAAVGQAGANPAVRVLPPPARQRRGLVTSLGSRRRPACHTPHVPCH